MRQALATVTSPTETLEEAHEIVGRLTQAGFARNSIDVEQRAEAGFAVVLHVREVNRARAERAIRNQWGLGTDLSVSRPGLLLIAGGAAVLGAGLWAAWSTNTLPAAVNRMRGRGDAPERA